MTPAYVLAIETHYDPPPIPDRRFDWTAIDGNTYEPGLPVGYGRTEAAAIADLIDKVTP